jgi:hypothetical protein
MFWNKKPQPKPETAAERAVRMEKNLRRNPATGIVLITRRYVDACLDEIMEEPCQQPTSRIRSANRSRV